MKKFIIIVFISLFAWSIPAFGSEWVLFNATADGKHYYEKESIEKNGKVLKVWTMSEHRTPRKDKKGKAVVTDMFLSEIDCSERTMKAFSITKVYEDKTSSSDYVNGKPVAIQPDSMGDILLQAVCR